MNFDDIIKQVEDNTHSAFFYTPSIYQKATSYLFLKPIEIISINSKDNLEQAFRSTQKLIDKKYSGYTLINYEAGYLFEKKLKHLLNGNHQDLLKFYFFDKKEIKKLKSSSILIDKYSSSESSVSNFELNKTESQFQNDLEKIKYHIKEGNTYQVNYTAKGKFNFSGSYSSLFKKLLFNQSAKYSAFINDHNRFILSLSPELFFEKNGNTIFSKPMKGTIKRGFDQQSDEKSKTELKSFEKNIAENVMIVDLIRNDLGRICQYGSIEVPELFKVEKYESLFQMVSNVRGKLRKNTGLSEIIQNIFPCGSVTGAPKIRTMEIIKEIEKEERGIYTGSIGLMIDKKIIMNVAIRTITIDKKTGDGVMGLGSGIVWDSIVQNEYEEVILKSKFLTEQLEYFEIFETMRIERGKIKFYDEHIQRMKTAAKYFLFKFSEKKIRAIIDIETAKLNSIQNKIIRLTLNKWGRLKVEVSEIQKNPKSISIIISKNKINSQDKFRYFKTTNRELYDSEFATYKSKGFYEVIYFNEKGELAEGSRTNIFIRRNKSWYTPKLESGILPGIYRNYFISQRNILEKYIYYEELINADEIILTNSVRGEVKVNKLYTSPEKFILLK